MNKKDFCVFALTLFAFLLCIFSGYKSAEKVKAGASEYITCAMIGDQKVAQADYALFLNDPEKYRQFKNLDGDHDGIPCEAWKNKRKN